MSLVGCGQPESAPPAGLRALALAGPNEIDLVPTTLGPAARSQGATLLAPTGAGYVIAWPDGREGFGTAAAPARPWFTRVAADGTVRDPIGVPLLGAPGAFGANNIAAACDDAEHCLFLGRGDDAGQALVAIRTSGADVLDATPRLVASSTVTIFVQSVAWDGARFRLMWTDVDQNLTTATMALDGTIDAPVAVAPASFAALACQRPQCVVTYRVQSGSTPPSLRSRPIDAAGALGPEAMVAADITGVLTGRLTWDGARYWLPTARADGNDVLRIATDGSPLDAAPIVLAVGPGQGVPTLAHDGSQTIALWDRRVTQADFEIRAARIAGSGAVLDPDGVVFRSAQLLRHLAFATCRADGCLAVVSVELQSGGRPFSLQFAGTTPQGDERLIATARPAATDATATYAHGEYVAIWSDSRDSSSKAGVTTLRGAKFGTDMVPSQTIEVPRGTVGDCPVRRQPSLAASATSYLLAWNEQCSSVDGVFAQMLDASGQPIGEPFTVRQKAQRPAQHPAAASDGNAFLLLWEDRNDAIEIRAQRYDAAGARIGLPFTFTSGFLPAVAFDGTSYVSVWRRTVGGQRDLFSERVSPAGDLLGEVAITTATGSDEGHSLACGVGMCGVAWRNGVSEARFTRLGPDGSVLDPGGIVLATHLPVVPSAQFATSTTWDGEAFVVMWNAGNELGMARVSPTGVPSALPTIAPATPPQETALVSSGAGHVVALYDRFDPSPAFQIRRVRAVVIGDSGPPPVDAGVPDAVTLPDAAVDAAPDASPDAAVDAPPDAAVDAPPDAAVDVPPDAAVDAPPDAAVDAPPDAAVDAPPDAAVDAPPDGAAMLDAAAPTPDAAAPPPPPPPTGCQVAGDPSLLGWLAGVGLAFTARRRRTVSGAAASDRPRRSGRSVRRPRLDLGVTRAQGGHVRTEVVAVQVEVQPARQRGGRRERERARGSDLTRREVERGQLW